MKNYISQNIDFLVKKMNSSQNEFGKMFGLGTGIVSSYITKNVIPKIETIQKICIHFEITIDDFINKDLSKENVYGIKQGKLLFTNEEGEEYEISPRYVEALEKAIIDKDKIINMLEDKLALHEKNNTA
ncbi:hypothetical protein [Flavobacterium sp.]|uniref:hypothetical protein n=1 Tax=Flavobacterium sp. TaxID=239 RepID=UPI0039198440